MYKVNILIVGDSFKDYNSLIQEYLKRLGSLVKIINIKPYKSNNKDLIIKTETKKIIELLKKDSNYKILLSLNGECKTTQEIKDVISYNLKLTFIIGGAFGLDEKELDKYIDMKLAFGKHTKNHLLVLTELLEQLFRIKTILEGRKYHY